LTGLVSFSALFDGVVFHPNRLAGQAGFCPATCLARIPTPSPQWFGRESPAIDPQELSKLTTQGLAEERGLFSPPPAAALCSKKLAPR
jgi:hypothetical protein